MNPWRVYWDILLQGEAGAHAYKGPLMLRVLETSTFSLKHWHTLWLGHQQVA